MRSLSPSWPASSNDLAVVPLIALRQSCKLQRQSFSLQNPPCKILQIQLVYATEYKRVALNTPSDAVRQHHAYRQFDGTMANIVFEMTLCVCPFVTFVNDGQLSAVCNNATLIGANVTSRSVDKYCQACPSLSLADIKIQTVCSHTHLSITK